MSLGAISLAGCSNNGEGSKTPNPDEKVPCKKHTWGDWVRTEEPTEGKDGKEVATCTVCGATKDQKVPALGYLQHVTFKNADGSVLKEEDVRSINKVTKPADPTAPEGQVFYGWKNVKNGGQIWNFDDNTLAKPQADIELVPCFVPANINPQYLEAELAPVIQANGGIDGATYSGGAKGKQFIYEDSDKALGSTCEIEPFKYYLDNTTLEPVIATDDTAPQGASLTTVDPKGKNSGYFIHFNYKKGNTFTFKINASKAVDDAVIFGRFSAEYGKSNDRGELTCSFSQTSYPISVNGNPLQYGTVTMHSIPDIGNFLPFQDYFLGANVSLKQGENVITMVVDNEDTLNGTIASTAPCVDSIKVYTSAALTWGEADYTNLIK